MRRTKRVGSGFPALPAPSAAPPRLSKTALEAPSGAGRFFVIIILSLCVITLWLTLSIDSLFPLLSPILILLLATPVAVPILGYIALNQIRHSAGSLYGLGLAVFDLLAFPLLALDAVIGGLGILAARASASYWRNVLCWSGCRLTYRCRVCRHRLPHHPLGLAGGESAARWWAPG